MLEDVALREHHADDAYGLAVKDEDLHALGPIDHGLQLLHAYTFRHVLLILVYTSYTSTQLLVGGTK